MTMSAGGLDPSNNVSWDQLLYQANPDIYAPEPAYEYTSSAYAQPDYASDYIASYGSPEIFPEAAPASDVYSSAYAEPVYEYSPPAAYDAGNFGYSAPAYDAPANFGFSPEVYGPPDPYVTGFGSDLDAWESPYNFTQDEAFSTVSGDDIGGRSTGPVFDPNMPLDQSQVVDARGFFASRNPQFAESNAQFDFTSNPANRTDAFAAATDLPPLDEIKDWANRQNPGGLPLTTLQDAIGDLFEFSKPLEYMPQTGPLGNLSTILGLLPDVVSERANREVGEATVPTTPLEIGLQAIPAARYGPTRAGLIELLGGQADNAGYAAIDNLPDALRLRSLLQVPEYSDEAAQLAGQAGRTAVPKVWGPAQAETAPFGMQAAARGASDDVTGLTANGEKVLKQAEAAGGPPAYSTTFMKKAALENGVGDRISVESMKPDEIIDGLKRIQAGEAPAVTPPKPRAPRVRTPKVAPVADEVAKKAEEDAARANFQRKWAEAYGDRPNTIEVPKREIPQEPVQELSDQEARRIARMSDAELAQYNAGRAQPQGEATGVRSVNPSPAARRPRTITEPATEVSEGISRNLPTEAASSAPPPPRSTTAVADAPSNPERAGNILLYKYPEDVQPEIARWAQENPEAVQNATRGVVSNEQTMAEARQLIQDTGGNFKQWQRGEAFNATEITALRGILNEKTDAVLQAAKAVQEGATEANEIALINALREQARIQEAVHGVTAEAGRALQSLRMDAAYLASNPDSQMARKLVQEAGFDPDKMADVARMLTAAEGNPAQVNAIVRNLHKPGMLDYLSEIWINSLLAGPMTHVRNFLSNLTTTAISPLERGVAAAVDIPMSKIQGRKIERFFGEVGADGFGAISGIRDGLNAGLYTLTHNGLRPESMASKMEFEKAFKGKAGAVINAPSTMLEAADAFHYTINYRASLSANALRTARKEGLHGTDLAERVADLMANPPESLIKTAKSEAEYRVFRAPAGEWTRAIMNARDKIKPLRFVIPFLRTPANLMKFGIERSPLGLLDPAFLRSVKSGSPEASDRVARAIVGSSIAAGVALAAAEGNITGEVPSKEAVRDRFYREGKQPFSIKIGDSWISYKQMEPFNQAFAQVYSAVDSIREGKPADQAVTKALTNIGTNLVSQTYMTGLSDALNAIQDPDRYGSQWIGRTATGFMPFSSALRTAERAVDPEIRDAKGIKEIVQSAVPGWSSSLPPRLDAFGNEVKSGSPWYSPIGVSDEHISEVDAEIGRLGVEVGFVGDSIGGHKLSRAEKQDYQGLAGSMTYRLIETLISLPEWDELPDAEKQAALEDAVSDARTAARDFLEENDFRLPKEYAR